MLCLFSVSNQYSCRDLGTSYAMIFTSLPCAFSAMLRASICALASILPDGGTEATITSMPFSDSASVIPRQYCIPGRKRPASRISSKPSSPCARINVCFYRRVRETGVNAPVGNSILVPLWLVSSEQNFKKEKITVVIAYDCVLILDYPPKVLYSRIFSLPLRTAECSTRIVEDRRKRVTLKRAWSRTTSRTKNKWYHEAQRMLVWCCG